MKTKVLIFEPEITENGVSKILSDFMNNFDDRIICEILTFGVTNNIYLPNDNIVINNIGNIKNPIKRIYQEYKIMKSGFDVVHVNGNYISRVIECFSAKIAGIKKIIIHSHNNGYENNSKIKLWIHNMFKWLFNLLATDYLACSSAAADWMFSKKIIKNRKFKVINNGIEIEKFKYDQKIRSELRKEYSLENKFVIGNVGRFVYQKNHKFLLEIFNECKKNNKNCVLMLIGTGNLENELKKQAEELGLLNDILFLGNTNEVYKFYNAMDCFVLTSKYEGLGIVNIEAQASGLNTIVSDKVPMEAKVSNLIEFVSLDKTANIWADIILNKTINDDRKQAYKEIIKNKYDIKSAANELINIYLK